MGWGKEVASESAAGQAGPGSSLAFGEQSLFPGKRCLGAMPRARSSSWPRSHKSTHVFACTRANTHRGWGVRGPSEKQKGKDPTKKAVGLRLAALGASALVLGFLVAPQTSKALHESLWPQKQ